MLEVYGTVLGCIIFKLEYMAIAEDAKKYCGLQDWSRSWVFSKVEFSESQSVIFLAKKIKYIMQVPNT